MEYRHGGHRGSCEWTTDIEITVEVVNGIPLECIPRRALVALGAWWEYSVTVITNSPIALMVVCGKIPWGLLSRRLEAMAC